PAAALPERDAAPLAALRGPPKARLGSADRALGAVRVEHHPGSGGARTPPAQPACQHAEGLVPRHEPGHEQNRGLARATPRPAEVVIGKQSRQLEAVTQLTTKRCGWSLSRRKRRRHLPSVSG